MDNNFSVFKGNKDDLPVTCILDESSKNYAGKSSLPWYVEIIIFIRDPDSDGQPFKGEEMVLNHFEDEIEKIIQESTNVKFIGRVTWNGYRNLYYYVQDGKKVNQSLSKILEGENEVRPFQYKIEKDENWNKVNEIFP